MNTKIPQPYFLIALITVSLVLTFFIFRPFLIVLVLAAVFAVVLHPLYQKVLRAMSGSPGLAAFVTMVFSVVCILVPLSFITSQIVGEAENLYEALSGVDRETSVSAVLGYAYETATEYLPGVVSSEAGFSSSVDTYIKNGLEWLVQNLGGAFGGAARFLLSLFVFMIALYYFLRDGARIKQAIIEISPIADADEQIVFTRLTLAVNSVIRGSLTIALIQGVLTGIGFTLFGIPNSVLWGVVATLSALIPGIGTSLVLAPGVAYLFIIGATTPALGLLVWSVLAVGLIDNFLGPRLMGRGMQLHPLIVLLSVFGGLAYFGPLGVFLGPLSISLFFALLSIYPHFTRSPA